MKFKLEELQDSVLNEFDDYGLEFIEATEFVHGHKYQTRYIIFKVIETGKFYKYEQIRSGSDFTDWEEEYWHHKIINGYIDLPETEKIIITTYKWS